MNDALWSPSASRIADARLTSFREMINKRHGLSLAGYADLHMFSVRQPEQFWTAIWDYCGIVGDRGGQVMANATAMPGAQFFPDARINFAENLLRRRDDGEAIVFRGEDQVRERLTWRQLYDKSAQLHSFLKTVGVKQGERVAAMMPNMPQTIMAMLAATSLGAIWSSCSPDFGERGVLDRFGQIDPKVLIVCDGYFYNGKRIDIADKVAAIVAKLPTLERVVIVSYLGTAEALARRIGDKAITFDAALAAHDACDIEFVRVGFNDPLYILYSSGTTGAPKCIVHGVGGALIQHLKEHQLHCNLHAGDRLFYFTTCGWMMWNWLVGALASEVTLLLYDGSPFYPDGNSLFDYAQAERMTLFGTSAKFIDALKKSGLRPIETHDLSSIASITSTGSPLAAESFDYVYDAIKKDVHLASVSGGTDICACFVLGDPTAPVYRGEIQTKALGMDVEVWDENGAPLASGKGELVCIKPFPSMPIMFWNDPEGSKYRAAYFERFAGVWCHGDFAEWTAHGGMIIHGRSDATLNPGGVRIGTAEIYAQVEQIPQILEAIAIGQDWDNDVRVVLFVRLADGAVLDEALEKEIRARIRTGASPRHVPAKIVAVADIPRTKSGKITELAVRDMVHGREVKNREALANPEALDLYRDLPQLQTG